MTIEKLNNGAVNIAAMSLMDFAKELIEVSKQGYELDLTVEAGVPQNIGYLYVCTLFPTSTEEQETLFPETPVGVERVRELEVALVTALEIKREEGEAEAKTEVPLETTQQVTEAPKASKGGRPAGSKNKQ